MVIGAIGMKVTTPEGLKSLGRSLRRIGAKDSKLLNLLQRTTILKALGIELLEFLQRGSFSCGDVYIDYLSWQMDHEMIDRE